MYARRRVLVAGFVLAVVVALVAVEYVREDSAQQAYLNASFVGIPRLPDAIAVNTRHDSLHIAESYVSSRSPTEITQYYSEQLTQRGWVTSGATWSANGLVFQCFGDPTGQLTTKLTTRASPQPGSFTYAIDMSRNQCAPTS